MDVFKKEDIVFNHEAEDLNTAVNVSDERTKELYKAISNGEANCASDLLEKFLTDCKTPAEAIFMAFSAGSLYKKQQMEREFNNKIDEIDRLLAKNGFSLKESESNEE